MDQVLPAQHDTGEVQHDTGEVQHDTGEVGRAEIPQNVIRCTGGPVPFEVWQFRMYHRYHIMTCIFLGTIGLLQTLATQEFQGSLGGLLLAVAIFAPLRHAAHYARNQVWAHLFMEYLALAIPVIRLTVDSFTVSENSFEPLEICLREYGLGILCPVAMSIVFSTLPVRLSFVIIANICYAARLATTINKLMIANNLNAAGDSIYVAWDIHVGSMLPVYVFAISLFANILSTRLGRSLFEHMAQLERAHRQEVLATEHAIRCEHRAHEAERQNAEERLQQRNKCAASCAHRSVTGILGLRCTSRMGCFFGCERS
eukprot:6213601-Pleurochrysis_carterae.AAC.3